LKRIFDIVVSILILLIFFPFGSVISILILISSKGGIFYRQARVGLNNVDFKLLKFRTMRPESDKLGQLTVGMRDPRITKIGYFLRKYKLDEFPQFFNVLRGEMSIIGPRPEVREYVEHYSDEQLKVLLVKPGITDYASLHYFKENEILGLSEDPVKTYIQEVMPAKLALNKKYVEEQSFFVDLKIMWQTFLKIVS
jgi:lipopolysaccharide/colanic/teichoic acid biosynthesis glycosyltransferase